MKKLKLLVIGNAQHGKDTVCEILQNSYGYSFKSSSEICNEEVVFPILSSKYGYKTLEECFNDRINHRTEWFNLIAEYNSQDAAKLARHIFSKYDIYCGMRNVVEFYAAKKEKLFDLSIYVDAEKRLPLENTLSFDIRKEDCDIILDNNTIGLENLKNNVDNLVFYYNLNTN